MEKIQLSGKKIHQYGVAGYAAMLPFTIIAAYGLYFFTNVVGMNPVIASTILMIGTLWDAVTDPIIGHWSDGRKSKYGRRRPVMIAVALPFGVVSWLLFSDFDLKGTTAIVYFITMILLFFTVQTFLDISYTSLGAEISKDYDERTSLSNSRGVWGCIAGIVASFTLVIADCLNQITSNLKVSWSLMAALFGLTSILSILYSWRKTRGMEQTDLDEHSTCPAKKEPFRYHNLIHGPFRNKSFLSVIGMFTFAIVAQSIVSSCIVYYELYNLEMTEVQISISQLIMYVVGFLSLPLIQKISLKYGKKAAWNLFIGIMIVSILSLILFILHPGMAMGMYLNSVLISAAFQAFYIIPWAMIPDTIEVDEYVTGKRREGLYYGVVTCVQKVGSSLAISFSGLYLSWIGYQAENMMQTEHTLQGLRYICSIGTAIPLLLSILCAVVNPMSKEIHTVLLEEIEQKKMQGENYQENTELMKKLRF